MKFSKTSKLRSKESSNYENTISFPGNMPNPERNTVCNNIMKNSKSL